MDVTSSAHLIAIDADQPVANQCSPDDSVAAGNRPGGKCLLGVEGLHDTGKRCKSENPVSARVGQVSGDHSPNEFPMTVELPEPSALRGHLVPTEPAFTLRGSGSWGRHQAARILATMLREIRRGLRTVSQTLQADPTRPIHPVDPPRE